MTKYWVAFLAWISFQVTLGLSENSDYFPSIAASFQSWRQLLLITVFEISVALLSTVLVACVFGILNSVRQISESPLRKSLPNKIVVFSVAVLSMVLWAFLAKRVNYLLSFLAV